MTHQTSYTQSISWLCSLGLFIAGYIFYTSSLIEPFYAKDFSLTNWQIGFAQAAVPIGAMIGAMLAGWLADLCGRNYLLKLNFLFLIALGIAAGIANNYTELCAVRLLNGFLAGTLYPLCAAYLTEMTPTQSLARKTAILMFVNCLAAPVGCIIAILLSFIFNEHLLWRSLSMCHIFPALCAYFWTKQLPESTAWMQHKQQQHSWSDKWITLRSIFNSRYRRITFSLVGTWFLMDVAYYGINFFVPYLLQIMQLKQVSSHFGAQTLLSHETIWGTFIINFFFMLGAGVAILVVERMNLYKLQQAGFLWASISLFLLAGYFYSGLQMNYLIIVLFVAFNFALNLGPDVTTYLFSATSYPVAMRGSGHGFVAGCAKMGSVLGVLFLPKLQALWGYEVVIILLAVLLFSAYLLTISLTRHATDLNHDIKKDLIYETN